MGQFNTILYFSDLSHGELNDGCRRCIALHGYEQLKGITFLDDKTFRNFLTHLDLLFVAINFERQHKCLYIRRVAHNMISELLEGCQICINLLNDEVLA